jgi:putative thioredoxin
MSEPQELTWINTTAETFEKDVLDRSTELPVVVDFWAPWCAPCRALGPVLENLAAEFTGRFLLVKANVDELPGAAGSFSVQGIPAVYAVIDRNVVDYFSGAIPEPMLRQWLDRVLAAGALLAAKCAEDASLPEAEARYRELLAADPRHVDAQIGLARTLLAQQRFDESRQIVADLEGRGYVEPEVQRIKASLELQGKQGVDLAAARAAAKASPNNLELQFQLAEALAGEKSYEESCEILLSLVERDRKGIGERARQLMVEIFQALPDDSEITQQFRRKLSLLLY